MYDHNGIVIPGNCGHYQVTAGVGTNDWEILGSTPGTVILFKNWTLVGVDLSPYLGELVTIEFKTEDCGWGGHFGYAYVDVNCGPLAVVVHGYCPGSSDITLTAPGGFTGYLWEPSGDTLQTITLPIPSEGDSIWLHLTNEAGCSTSILHVFDELSFPDSIQVFSDTTICAGQPVELISSGAGYAGNYQWESVPPGSSASGDHVIFTPDISTTYCVNAFNQYYCQSVDTACVTVNVIADSDISLGIDRMMCAGDSLHLFANPGFEQYSWYINGSFVSHYDTLDLLPVSAITTIVISAEGQFCSARDTLIVNLSYPHYNGADSIVSFCQDVPQLILTAPPGNAAFSWSGGSTGNQLAVNNPQNQQIYSVILTSQQGCVDSLNFILDSNTLLYQADAGADFRICNGHPVNLHAAFCGPDAAYTWRSIPPGYNASGRNATFFPDSDTYFILDVSSSLLCGSFNSDTVFVSILPTPVLDLGNDTALCPGDTLVINRSIPGYFNYWYSIPAGFNSEDSTIYVSPQHTTTYVLNLLNEFCTISDLITVTVNPGLNTHQQVFFCPADTLPINLIVSGNYSNVYWPYFDTISNSVLIHPPFPASEVQAIAANSSGCIDTLGYLFGPFNNSLHVTSSDNNICVGDPVILTASQNGSATVHWSSAPPLINLTGQSIAVSPTVNTTYFAEINFNGCTFSSSVTIDVSSFPAFDIGDDISVCPGDLVSISAPVTANEYSWYTTPSGFSSSLSAIEFIPSNNTILHLRAGNGACFASDEVNITIYDIPLAEHLQHMYYCTGNNEISLSAPEDFSGYYWAPSGETSQTIMAYADASQDITLSLTTSEGCRDTVMFQFTEKIINVDSWADPWIICNGQASSLHVDNRQGVSYKWFGQNGNMISQSPDVILDNVTSDYYYVLTDSAGCNDVDTLTIKKYNYPVINIGNDTVICPGTSITLDAGAGNENYLWSDLSTSSFITVDTTGLYSVISKNWECSSYDQIFVEQLKADTLFVPNVFTPGDDDGFNDKFTLIINNTEEFMFTVYNRYGEKIYHTTNPDGSWNGKIGGVLARAGTYFWVLKYKTICSESFLHKEGFLTLIR